jgi:hypothetical protein
MRFNLLARRIMAPALGLALAATVAACSSSSATTAASSGSSSPAAASSTSGTASAPAPSSPTSSASSSSTNSGGEAATAAITANWEAFFDGKTSAAKKISLLENGSKFAPLIDAQAGSGLASSAGAKVTAVVVNSATSATVSYNITLGGATALSNQTGTAVYQDGIWKVGDVSFCSLIKLEDAGSTTPSVCSG